MDNPQQTLVKLFEEKQNKTELSSFFWEYPSSTHERYGQTGRARDTGKSKHKGI